MVLLGYSCSFPNPSNVTRYSNRCTNIKSIFNKMELFFIHFLKDLIKEISPDAYSKAFRDGLLHKMLPYVGQKRGGVFRDGYREEPVFYLTGT